MSPLARDLSTLPKDSTTTQGCPPDSEPRFVHLLVERMQAHNDEAGDKPTAYGTRIRHSDAGKCARAIAFRALGVKGEPMDQAGVWVTSLGTLIHEHWQDALQAVYPDAEVEPKLRIDGLDASGHADAVVNHEGKRILVELKTTGGFGYKKKVGDRGQAEGPSYEHILQAALNGAAVDADEIVIAYMATEAISRQAAKGKKHITELTRFCAEWTFTREEYEPLARKEQERLQGILDVVDGGELPRRIIPSPELPKGAEIVDPLAGRFEVRDHDGRIADTGTWWSCQYCPFQSTCATTGSGRVPVSSIVPEAVAS
jgi:hypothetical protein